ncbi:MAG: TIGR02391 family protein [Dehalococcoidales bacterium]|nr:TIGR02391 family protein [Dehalococcoidales bacterium]
MDKKEAISYLQDRLTEIPTLVRLAYDNQEYPLWRYQIEDVLEEVFGHDSKEHKRFVESHSKHRSSSLDGSAQRRWYSDELKMCEIAILSIIKTYETLGMKDKPAGQTPPDDTAKSPIQLFDALRLRQEVVEASRELFKDGHYRDAIFRAFVEVNNFVKRKAKCQLDGKSLMAAVFSLQNPKIRLNSLETQTDKDEQEGFMYLFMGAMQGIRNPKAHENIIQNNPYIAAKLIGFASLLIETISFWKA